MEEPTTKVAKKRYNTILKVALQLFLEKGYENTSLQDIIKASGGSLATIYKYFDGKDGLFYAILRHQIHIFESSAKNSLKIDEKLEVKDYLRSFGEFFINAIYDRQNLQLFRIIMIESFRDGGKMSDFFNNYAMTSLNNMLAVYFKKNSDKFRFSDHHFLASTFIALIRRNYMFDTVVSKSDTENAKKEKLASLDSMIDIFLAGTLKK